MCDERWLSARRILAIRLDNLGDVLVTSPALHAIKQSCPNAQLTLLASPVGAQAGRLHPDVDEVIVYEAPWMDPWQQLPQDPAREAAMLQTIRERRFDGAIIFTSFRQSALPAAYLCYLAGIPLRHAASVDGPGSLLTTRHRHPEHTIHEVERGLDLVGTLDMTTDDDRLVLRVPDGARRAAREFIAAHRLSEGPIVVVHPGCSMPARTYPPELFAAAADQLVDRLDATVIVTGSAGERDLAHRVTADMMTRPAVDAAGILDFPAFAGLIAEADLTVTNNTGPMHISAAVGTPAVALFALTNIPEQWGPWKAPHRTLYHDVPCRICYHRVCPFGHECLTLVDSRQVVDAATSLLGLGTQTLSLAEASGGDD
jgi:ADP-heptose:LPS heptosyltransferase